MATRASNPVPDGMNTVTTHLFYNGNCRQAIEFYKKAFNAELVGRIADGPDGRSVMHALIRIGDTNIMMADAMPGSFAAPSGPASAYLMIYTENCDAMYNQAINAGCSVIYEMMDAFWGDRLGTIRDPYGHCWSIASHTWELTPDEVARAQAEWVKNMPVGN